MTKRRVAAGMLEAERFSRRVRGDRDMATLLDALRRQVMSTTVESVRQRPD